MIHPPGFFLLSDRGWSVQAFCSSGLCCTGVCSGDQVVCRRWRHWAHTSDTFIRDCCTLFSFSCPAVPRKASRWQVNVLFQLIMLSSFHRWRMDRCELFNFGYFFSCDNILERKWNLKILGFQLQTSKVWMLKADSEAVKANGSSYLILLCHFSNRRICVIGLYK